MEKKEKSSAIQFPCDFTIKIVGKTGKPFETALHEIFLKHGLTLSKKNFTKRLSRDANYLAFTVTIHVETKKALDAIYQELTDSPQVIMAL